MALGSSKWLTIMLLLLVPIGVVFMMTTSIHFGCRDKQTRLAGSLRAIDGRGQSQSGTSGTATGLEVKPMRRIIDWGAVEVRGRRADEPVSNKWIVVTTINYPTKPLQVLASQPGWKVVVVGDTKTPKDWNLTNCVFLDLAAQHRLGYRITPHLPTKSYARKNIGYLYAVHHGAEIIYEADDDNQLLSGSIVLQPEWDDLPLYAPHADQLVVNPYEHFGQKYVWPRGFPLELIVSTRLRGTPVAPAETTLIPIQQGLADLDPDVDAVFRLTHGEEIKRIRFDATAPSIALPAGVMCPFNSQNTVFYRHAFWGMLLPVTTTFRVCDIWRGYWAQRLLWEVGASLCFLPPTAVQNRNPHDYLSDFLEELALYKDAGRLVRFLVSWNSTAPLFFDRVVELSWAMSEAGFWGAEDAVLTEDWLQDLIAVGYIPPKCK